MSIIDKAKKKVSAREFQRLKDKFPQMTQKFEDVKQQIYEPQIQGLGQTQEHQDQHDQGQTS